MYAGDESSVGSAEGCRTEAKIESVVSTGAEARGDTGACTGDDTVVGTGGDIREAAAAVETTSTGVAGEKLMLVDVAGGDADGGPDSELPSDW